MGRKTSGFAARGMIGTMATVERVYNFSPGPAVLPLPVIEEAQRNLVALPGVGISVLEISHRSKPFEAILAETKQSLVELLGIPAGYQILFLQGGASLQFSMVPMNLLGGKSADYVRDRQLGSESAGRGPPCGRSPRGLGRQSRELQPLAGRRRAEAEPHGRLRSRHVERNDSGSAVPRHAARRERCHWWPICRATFCRGRCRSTATE